MMDELNRIRERTKDADTRAIVGLRKGWEELFAERLPLYERWAHVTVEIAGLTPEQTADLVIDMYT